MGLISVLLLAPSLATCLPRSSPQTCRGEAGEPIVVSVAASEANYLLHLSGTLESAEKASGLRPGRLTVRLDDADAVEVVEYRFTGVDLAFPVGAHLDITVEQVAGFPSYHGLVISDEKGLLLAAASDAAPGRSVMKSGVPDFEIRLRDAGCKSRDGGTCYDAITNLSLELRRGSSTLSLMQGESGDVGGFRVHCLVAENVVYSDDCADAGRVALSYLIVRSNLQDPQ